MKTVIKNCVAYNNGPQRVSQDDVRWDVQRHHSYRTQSTRVEIQGYYEAEMYAYRGEIRDDLITASPTPEALFQWETELGKNKILAQIWKNKELEEAKLAISTGYMNSLLGLGALGSTSGALGEAFSGLGDAMQAPSPFAQQYQSLQMNQLGTSTTTTNVGDWSHDYNGYSDTWNNSQKTGPNQWVLRSVSSSPEEPEESLLQEKKKMDVKLTLKEAQYLEEKCDTDPTLKAILAKIEGEVDFQIVVSFRKEDD